jgi:hypothetical protein
MLLTIGFAFIVLWIIAFVLFPLMGWFVHVLLVVAIIAILLRIIRGK